MNCQELLASYRGEMAKRIVGQKDMVDSLLMALIAGGHVLLEGVPGLAKTLAVKSLAGITGLSFKRIQFTPDLLPADLTGTLIWEPAHASGGGSFSVRKGPVFANVILADEINRSPAKVQSALLEAMEERQVTIGEETHQLPDPFFVLATENPIDFEGTYELPEAELDRFLIKLSLSYPNGDEELAIVAASPALSSRAGSAESLRPLLDREALASFRLSADKVKIDEKMLQYIVSIVAATRQYKYISFGASPRASIALARLARIRASFEGRDFVSPGDIKALAPMVLRHRLVLSYEAEAEGINADGVISRILAHVPIPLG
ncbi:MAG: MoxR family ATPase [Treponema sp.]|nr:MoxR family ATPase [Treponema sp.]